MVGIAGGLGGYIQQKKTETEEVTAAAAQLLEAFHKTQPEFQAAMLKIAEVYAERYPQAMGLYIV